MGTDDTATNVTKTKVHLSGESLYKMLEKIYNGENPNIIAQDLGVSVTTVIYWTKRMVSSEPQTSRTIKRIIDADAQKFFPQLFTKDYEMKVKPSKKFTKSVVSPGVKEIIAELEKEKERIEITIATLKSVLK